MVKICEVKGCDSSEWITKLAVNIHNERCFVKKINSIGYAHKIIGLAGLFLAAIPFCCYIFHFIFRTGLFLLLMYISLGIGFLVLLFFIVLLGIEFHQDKKIDRQYTAVRKTKLALGNGFYECQSCGSRKVHGTDKSCRVCGTTFLHVTT